MNEQIFFKYLPGEWLIEREIINRLSLSSSASGFGKVDIVKKDDGFLIYKELLKVRWANGFSSNSKKRYDYIVDDVGHIGLHNYEDNKKSFMFNLFFEPSDSSLIKGEYQCVKDFYYTTYKIINDREFTLTFQVSGPQKDYFIKSCFFRKL